VTHPISNAPISMTTFCINQSLLDIANHVVTYKYNHV
jgi:hypothetical protein